MTLSRRETELRAAVELSSKRPTSFVEAASQLVALPPATRRITGSTRRRAASFKSSYGTYDELLRLLFPIRRAKGARGRIVFQNHRETI